MSGESQSIADLLGGSESPTVSDDLTCEVCGKALVYSGRGRKPKFCDEHKQSRSSSPRTSSAPRSTGNVNSALQVMETGYAGLSVMLRLFSPTAAVQWESSHDSLIETDRQAFTADPKLAQRIAKLGQTSGTAMFIGAHVFALAPVVMIVRADIQNRQAERQVNQPTEMPNDDPNMEYSGAESTYPNKGFFEGNVA